MRVFTFDPATVATDACPLVHVEDAEVGGWVPEDDEAEASVQASNTSLARMEMRIRQMHAAVSSQANELEELDRRLAEAERRHAELESKTA